MPAVTPLVRVYVPTYRRHRLLERAVASLRAQTFGDWVCEVHNDDPLDDAPRKLLDRLGDGRIALVQHERNFGGTATFNLFYRGCREPYFSLLEDDNWWEPGFLERMLSVAEDFPLASVLWANMRVWQELADGSFRDTGHLIHPFKDGQQPELRCWGSRAQMTGALHSNGAALHRVASGIDYRTPAVPFVAMEMFRERMFPHPLLFVPEPLANFSCTLQSERDNDGAGDWAETQTVMAATFLKHARLDERELSALWAEARTESPPGTSVLIFAALVDPDCRPLLRYTRPVDWFRWLRSAVRSPGVLRRVLDSRLLHPDWWEFLECHTAARFREASES